MSTAVMMERIADASPRLKAKIAEVFYLLTILARVIADPSFVTGWRYRTTPRQPRPTSWRTYPDPYYWAVFAFIAALPDRQPFHCAGSASFANAA